MKNHEGREIGSSNRCPVCGDVVFVGDRFEQPKADPARYVIGHYRSNTRIVCEGSGRLPVTPVNVGKDLMNLFADTYRKLT